MQPPESPSPFGLFSALTDRGVFDVPRRTAVFRRGLKKWAAAKLGVLWVAALLAWPSPALAHKVQAVRVVADFQTAAETKAYELQLAIDVYPSEDPGLNDAISAEDAALEYAKEGLVLYFDDEPHTTESVDIEVLKPEGAPEADEDLQQKKIVATLKGKIPPKATYFTLQVSADTTPAIVMIVVVDGKTQRRAQVIYPGEFGNPVELRPAVEGDPFTGTGTKAEGEKPAAEPPGVADTANEVDRVPDKATSKTSATPVNAADNGVPGAVAAGAKKGLELDGAAPRPFRAGFQQVIPPGWAYVLFLLGMFFLTRRLHPLLLQVAAYCVAQTTGTALAYYGLIDPPMFWVSVVMVLGVIYLGVENIFTPDLKMWRLPLVCVFGLAHGCGLANGLGGVQDGRETGGIMRYLLGVETANLVILLLAFVAVSGFWTQPWYRKKVEQPVSALIALGGAVLLFLILNG